MEQRVRMRHWWLWWLRSVEVVDFGCDIERSERDLFGDEKRVFVR